MTPAAREELARLVAEATPGPWKHYDQGERENDPDTGETIAFIEGDDGKVTVAGDIIFSNAEFIVAARTAIPALLSEIARLEARNAAEVRVVAVAMRVHEEAAEATGRRVPPTGDLERQWRDTESEFRDACADLARLREQGT